MTARLRWAAALMIGAMGASSCGRPPRPPELAHAQEVSAAPAMRDAAALAPQATAHADQLRRQAEKAYEDGQIAAAGILAERAVAAFERAAVLARTARAAAEAEAARAEMVVSEARLRELEAEQARVEADTIAIDNLLQVLRDAEPVARSGRSTADREQARFEAARSIAVDARLLCAAASLLGRPVEGLTEAQTAVTSLEEALSKKPRPAPIDDALRARARCLALLTLARRADNAKTADTDVVLTELTATPNLEPRRDDRGLVVILRGDAVSSDQGARRAVAPLAAVAAAHPEYPLLVVAHTSSRPSKTDEDRAGASAARVVKALEAAGIVSTRLRTEMARGALPILAEPVPPPRPSRNERVEVILVAPQT